MLECIKDCDILQESYKRGPLEIVPTESHAFILGSHSINALVLPGNYQEGIKNWCQWQSGRPTYQMQ